jgi:hypothetical protein
MGALSGFLRGVERSSRQWPAAIMQQKSRDEQREQEQQRLAREAIGFQFEQADAANDAEGLTTAYIAGSKLDMFPKVLEVPQEDGTVRFEHPTLTAILARNVEEQVQNDAINARIEQMHKLDVQAADDKHRGAKIARAQALQDLKISRLQFEAGEVDIDHGAGLMTWQRLDPETGRYVTQFLELDLPKGYVNPAEEARVAKLHQTIISDAHSKLGGATPTEAIMTGMEAAFRMHQIPVTEKYMGQLREAVSAVRVNIMGAVSKSELSALSDYRSAQSMAAGILHKVAALSDKNRGELNKITGTWNVESMKRLGGAGVNTPLTSLMADLAGLHEVFARAQTGAAINAGEEARFQFLTGSAAMGPTSLQARLVGMINFGKERRLGIYGSALDNIHATTPLTAGDRAGYEENFEKATFAEDKWAGAISPKLLKFYATEKNRLTSQPLYDWAIREMNRRAKEAANG